MEGLSWEYGGDNTSNIAHGLNAVKLCIFPPLLGNNTLVSLAAFNTPSLTLPATPPETTSPFKFNRHNNNNHLILKSKSLTYSRAWIFDFDPIKRFHIHRTVENFAKHCHSWMIMEWKCRTSWKTKHTNLYPKTKQSILLQLISHYWYKSRLYKSYREFVTLMDMNIS